MEFKMSLLIAGGLGYMTFKGPFQLKLCYDSMINIVPIWVLLFSINFPALIIMGWQIKGLQLNPVLPSGPGRRQGKEHYIPPVAQIHTLFWKSVFHFLPG